MKYQQKQRGQDRENRALLPRGYVVITTISMEDERQPCYVPGVIQHDRTGRYIVAIPNSRHILTAFHTFDGAQAACWQDYLFGPQGSRFHRSAQEARERLAR